VDKRTSSFLTLSSVCVALAAFVGGCVGDFGGDPSQDSVTAARALDNATADGTACYQDVPIRKGSMSYGLCCFDDPEKGTSVCITCDAAHHCTVGGAEPGALIGGVRSVGWNGGVISTSGTNTSTTTLSSGAIRAAALQN